jgi:hypothetical protein
LQRGRQPPSALCQVQVNTPTLACRESSVQLSTKLPPGLARVLQAAEMIPGLNCARNSLSESQSASQDGGFSGCCMRKPLILKGVQRVFVLWTMDRDKNGHDGRNGQEWTAEWTMDDGRWTMDNGRWTEIMYLSGLIPTSPIRLIRPIYLIRSIRRRNQ